MEKRRGSKTEPWATPLRNWGKDEESTKLNEKEWPMYRREKK